MANKEEKDPKISGSSLSPIKRREKLNIPKTNVVHHPWNPTSLEASDVSMDISDITMEIEKLGKEKENPEEAIHNSTKLLKEIDHQMEMSFEIMEERSNMVREYLKEREKSELMYKNKADKMMENFNKKMQKLESSLSLSTTLDEQPKIKSSQTQTATITVNNMSVQTQIASIPESSSQKEQQEDFDEIVAALTEDMQEAVSYHYAKERQTLLCEIAIRKNVIDKAELESYQSELNQHMDGDLERDLKQIASSLASDYFLETNHDDFDKKHVMKYIQNKDIMNLPEGFPKKDLELLEKYKNLYKQKVKEYSNARIQNTQQNLEDSIRQLRAKFYTIYKLQTRYEKILCNLSTATDGKQTNEIDFKLREINSGSDNENKNKMVEELRENLQGRNDAFDTQKLIQDGLSCLEELSKEEEQLRNDILPNLTLCQERYWKRKLALAYQNNDTLLREQEEIIQKLQGVPSEDKSLIVHPSKLYIEPMEIKYEEIENANDLLHIKPKIGQELIEKLLDNGKSSSDHEEAMLAVDIIKYQNKPIQNVLKDYEEDLTALGKSLNENIAYKEVMEMIVDEYENSQRDLTIKLSDERENVENELNVSRIQHKKVKTEIKDLKKCKDVVDEEEQNLQNQKKVLENKLKEINRKIADKFMQTNLREESLVKEKRLESLTNQIQSMKTHVEPNSDAYETTSIDSINQRLGVLRKDLEKLLPFINDNIRKTITQNKNIVTPNNEKIDEVLATKSKLSTKLLEAEKRIQEIITSDGYDESSVGSGTMENIEEMQRDPSSSPTDVFKRSHSTSPQSLNLDLNHQLLGVEMELGKILSEIQERKLDQTACDDLNANCEKLKLTIAEVEKTLFSNNQSKPFDSINTINKEIEKLKKELETQGVSHTKYDKSKEEELLQGKQQIIDRLKQMKEVSTSKKKYDNTISVALKDLLLERDRTQSIILGLDEDIHFLDELAAERDKNNKKRTLSFQDQIMGTNKQLLERKAGNVFKMVHIAKNRLGYFINLVKIKMKERLEEASKTNWVNKQRLSQEEKQKLGTELRDTVSDIKQTEAEIQELTDYKENNTLPLNNESSLQALFDKKNSLMERIEAICKDVEKAKGDKNNTRRLLTQKSLLRTQLVDLNERINNQDTILEERLCNLRDIKTDLEKRLAESVDVNDLKKIIAELDKKDTVKMDDLEEGEGSMAKLLKERSNVAENILRVVHSSPYELGKIQRMNDVLEGIDVEIFTQLEEILAQLDTAPDIAGEERMEAFELLSTTASAFKFLQEKSKLTRALKISETTLVSREKVKNPTLEDIRQDREEISRLETLRGSLNIFLKRGIDISQLEEIKKFKNLNEQKLDKLLAKIKNLNQLVDTQKRLDRKAKSIEELSVGDLQQISITNEMLTSELQSIIKCYDNEMEDVIGSKHPTRTPLMAGESLGKLLEKRDQKLNKLFLIEKEIEEQSDKTADMGELKVEQNLIESKRMLTKEIEQIDERIISAQYFKDDSSEQQNLGSPTRSFSPRSTSSRTSFTIYMEERDQILRELFTLKKNKEKLLHGGAELEEYTSVEEISTKKDELTGRLSRLTKRMLGDRDNDVSIEPQQHNVSHVLDGENIAKEVTALEIELQQDKLYLHHYKNGEIQSNSCYHCNGEQQLDSCHHGEEKQTKDAKRTAFENPPELECLEEIRQLENKLNLESMKKALQSLEEEKRIIEENMSLEDGGKRDTFTLVRKKLEETKRELKQNQENIQLLKRRQHLESKLKGLKKNIESNVKLTDKLEELDHKEFVKYENNITLREHKRNKVKLEKHLDEINNVLYHYTYSIEREIDNIQHEHAQKQRAETFSSLKEHESVLKESVKVMKVNLEKSKEIPSIDQLLSNRRKTHKDLIVVNKEIECSRNEVQNAEIINSIRKAYSKEYKIANEEAKLQYKHKILSKKIKDLEKAPNNSEQSDLEAMRKTLGNNLYELVHNPKSTDTKRGEKLGDLKQCLEDRTLEIYIQDLQNLCNWQNEQVENLKTKLSEFGKEEKYLNDGKLGDKTFESERDDMDLNNQEMFDKDKDKGMNEVKEVRIMLQKLQDELVIADTMQQNFMKKLGPQLYEIINIGELNQSKNIGNFETKSSRYLENLKTIINKNEATLQEIIEENFTELECINNEKEGANNLINQLHEERLELAKRLLDQDEEIEIWRKRDEQYSETESHRENFQRQTSIVAEENQKLKDEQESLNKKVRSLEQENNEISKENQKIKDEQKILIDRVNFIEKERKQLSECNADNKTHKSILLSEIETLKCHLTKSNGELERLSGAEKGLQGELENLRKRLKKIIKEKSCVKVNLEREQRKIDSLQADLSSLQQKDKQAVHDMHRNCQIIEKHEKEIKKLNDIIAELEKEKVETHTNLNELKNKYQTMTIKCQGEAQKVNKELRTAKSKIVSQQFEIEKLTSEKEDNTLQTGVQNIGEDEEQTKKEAELSEQLDVMKEINRSLHCNVDDMIAKYQQLEKANDQLIEENQVLLKKLKDLDESFENEAEATRRDFNAKFNKTVDKLNKRIQTLANDLLQAEESKQTIANQNYNLKEQITDYLKKINEQHILLENRDKTLDMQMLSVNTELNSFRLENDELRDEILSLRKQIKHRDFLETLANDIQERREKLTSDLDKFEKDKNSFEENVHDFIRKKQGGLSSKNSEEKVSLALFTGMKEERDKLSNELIKSNRELHIAKNELRKLKMNLREKEQDLGDEEERVIQKIESGYQRKLDEQLRNYKNEKDQLLMMYNEERNKWEEEMKKLKQNLQEDTLKKLAEQRSDYEKELEKQVQLYVKQNEEDLEEERDKNARSEKQRKDMIEQFEQDKKKISQKYDIERQGMVEIIKRLLRHLMLLKKQRTRLRISYEDEISELEERFETEKKRMAEQKQKDVTSNVKPTKNNLQNLPIPNKCITGSVYKNIKDQGNNSEKSNSRIRPEKDNSELIKIRSGMEKDINTFKKILKVTPEKESDVAGSYSDSSYSEDYDTFKTMTMKSEKESNTDVSSYGDDYKLSLRDFRDLLRMEDLKEIIDSDYEEEEEDQILKKNVREQYEMKLRIETDYLMKRLLELSDELDALRAKH